MCCCMKKRDRSQLSVLLWRVGTVLKRNPKGILMKCIAPAGMVMIWYILNITVPVTTGDFKSLEQIQIANSQMDYGNSYFCREDLSTEEPMSCASDLTVDENYFQMLQIFEDCTIQDRTSIGIVYNTDNDKIAEANRDMATNFLFDIVDEIGQAYVANNVQNGTYPDVKPFLAQTHNTVADLQDYYTSNAYTNDPYCFSIGWAAFDITQKDEGKATFDLQIFNIAGQDMVSTNQPLEQYNGEPYNLQGFNLYSNGILQVMSIATRRIAEVALELGPDSLNFELLYTPMSTGDYTSSSGKITATGFMLFLVLLYMVILGLDILAVADEENEDKITNILKISGMSTVVPVTKHIILYTGSILIFGTLAVVFIEFPSYYEIIDFFLLTVLMWLMFFNYYILIMLRNYGLAHNKGLRFALTGLYILYNVLLMLFTTINPGIYLPASLLYATSWNIANVNYMLLKMVLAASSEGVKLSWNNLEFEGYQGYTIGRLLFSMLFWAVIQALFFLYLWKVSIDPDPENPYGILWACTCQCLRKKKANEGEGDVADTEDLNETEEAFNIFRQKLVKSEEENNGERQSLRETAIRERNKLLHEDEIQLINQGVYDEIHGAETPDRLQISNLVKTYGKKKAVNKLSLTVFKDEILVLLGHNGAGKTTTISMLTGFEKPTSGAAVIHSGNQVFDLFNEEKAGENKISVCPQENVLCLKMTVRENINFFAQFRGVENVDELIDQQLEIFNLSSKADALATNLSGGQKRKLQLLIALIGDQQLVLLDEPTSGMDPTARRETWDIIKKVKKDKIIILTTHYMDEAEVLADRVAIVSKGTLQCCGSPFFLKKRFGQGYFIEVSPLNANEREDKLLEHLRSFLPNAIDSIISENGPDQDELNQDVHVSKSDNERFIYQIPYRYSSHFKQIFDAIDADPASFNIKNYVLRVSTLEEVFIEIGRLEDMKDHHLSDLQNVFSQDIAAPKLQKYTPSQRSAVAISSMMKSNWQSGIFSGELCVLSCIAIAIIIFTLFTATFVNYPMLGLNDIAYIYPEGNLQLMYNPSDLGGKPTQVLADSIISYQNEYLMADPMTEWTSSTETLNLNQILFDASTQMVNSNKGSYFFVNAGELAKGTGTGTTKVAVFASLNSPVTVPVYGTAALQTILNQATTDIEVDLNFQLGPLPAGMRTSASTGNGTYMTITMLIIYMFMPPIEGGRLYGMQTLVKSGYYDALMMRGGTPGSYMIGMLVNSICVHLLFAAIMTLTMAGLAGFGSMGLIFLLYAIAEPLFIVSMSQLFIIRAKLSPFLVVGLLYLLYIIGELSVTLGVSALSNPSNQESYNTMMFMLTIVYLLGAFAPTMNLITGPFAYQTAFARTIFEDPNGQIQDVNFYGKYGAKIPVIMLVINILIYGALFLALACGSCQPGKPAYEDLPADEVEDEDKLVAAERARVSENFDKNQGEILKVQNLVKKYRQAQKSDKKDPQSEDDRADRPVSGQLPEEEVKDGEGKKAVKGISFGVKEGECFALLGVNGAGKSSTFKTMVGTENISGGSIKLDETDISEFYRKPWLLHKTLGYCPQYDCINSLLTVEQTLFIFARTAGIVEDEIQKHVTDLITKIGLSMFVNTKAGQLSGGNKRKLCLAMALIGRPKAIFIDEASAGVDPASRRNMWKTIKDQGSKSAVVITTHAMEEAESLSQKIGIMVDGKFKCYGSLAEIQSAYGQGYEIEVNIDIESQMEGVPMVQQEMTRSSNMEDIKKHLKDISEYWQLEAIPEAIDLVQEFTMFGIFQDQFETVTEGQAIDLETLTKEAVYQNCIGNILNELSVQASESTVRQLDGAYCSIRMSFNNKSYGFMFALLESMKKRYSIREYSIKQSTLEQVFNMFATEDAYLNYNRRISRRRSTTVHTQ